MPRKTAAKKKKDERLPALLDRLKAESKGLEASHPHLVETIDEICRFLAGLGI